MNISNLDHQKEASSGLPAFLFVAVTRREDGRSLSHHATNLVGGMEAPLGLGRAAPGPSLVEAKFGSNSNPVQKCCLR